jgi:hypothetical protein
MTHGVSTSTGTPKTVKLSKELTRLLMRSSEPLLKELANPSHLSMTFKDIGAEE